MSLSPQSKDNLRFVNKMNLQLRSLYNRGEIQYDNLATIVQAANTEKQLWAFLVSMRKTYPLILWGRNALDVNILRDIIETSDVVIENDTIRNELQHYERMKEERAPRDAPEAFLTRGEAISRARALSRTKKHIPTPRDLIRAAMMRRVEEGKLEEKREKVFGNLFAKPLGSGIKSRRWKKKKHQKKRRSRKRNRSRKKRRSN